MNKNTTDITLSSYFNDIVVGFYEDEDLVKDFGRKLGIDVDRDVFTAVSFLYVSDAYVRMEDQEKLIPAAQALLDYAPINQKIGGMQIVRTDMGVVVILIAHCRKDMYYILPDVKQEALKQLEQLDTDIKVRVGIGTMESGIKGIKHTYSNALAAVRTGEIFKPDRVILEFMGMEIYSAINEMVVNFGDRLTRTVLMQLGDTEKRVLSQYYKCKEDVAATGRKLDMTVEDVENSLSQVKINTGLDVRDNEDNFKLHFIMIAKKVLENDERIKRRK